jgi:hypothetical protein
MNDDSAHDDPIDLSPLDPTRDAARFAALASSIARDAMLARTRKAAAQPRDLLAELTAWWRPALAAAAIVLGVALPMLGRAPAAPSKLPAIASATDVLGIPRELMDLLASPRTPSLFQIDNALASTATTPISK